MPAITGVHHVSLTVTDLESSVSWYAQVLGLTKAMDEDHEGGRAVVLMQPESGVFLGLHAHDANDRATFDETRTGLDHVSFAVASRDDLASWATYLESLGVTQSPIADRPWGSVLVFRDPDNLQLELCSPPVG